MSSLSKIIFQSSDTFKDLTALKVGERMISYHELNENALLVASILNELGVEKEAIGLVGQRKASSYFGVLGIEFAGCHYIPINPKYSASRLQAIIEDANIRILVGDVTDLLKLEAVLGADNFPDIIIVPEGNAPADRKWINTKRFKNFELLTEPKLVTKDDLAYLLYTSGSTGNPKGVKVKHQNITAFLSSMANIYKLEPGFHASQTFDLSFDPSVSDMFFTWSLGGKLCILPEEEVMLPAEYIKREKISFWNSVPSLAVFMNKMGQLSENCFPDLKYSMFCGEQFPKYVGDAWKKAAPQSTIENLYGPTEATIYISRYIYQIEDVYKKFKNSIIPIGRPLPNHVVEIIDDRGNKLKKGEIGEICFKGDQVTDGYLNNPEKTANVFLNFLWETTKTTKWYKTGDLGFINSDGNVECIGRRDSQIKLAGRRMEIGEIESVLAKVSHAIDIVVVPLRDTNEIITGCVAFTTQVFTKEEENNIRQDSIYFLERIFFPRKIMAVDELPLTISGKIDRKKLEKIAREQFKNHNILNR